MSKFRKIPVTLHADHDVHVEVGAVPALKRVQLVLRFPGGFTGVANLDPQALQYAAAGLK